MARVGANKKNGMSEAARRQAIVLDDRNLHASAIGEHGGLSQAEHKAMLGRMAQTFKTFERERGLGQHAFLDLVDDEPMLRAIRRYASRRYGTFDDLLLLGCGGSSLGLVALDRALRPVERTARRPGLRVIDTTDPDATRDAMNGLLPERTHCLVISKSGDTLDTLAPLGIVDAWYRNAGVALERSMTVVTGHKSQGALRRYATSRDLTIFEIPEKVGGRYSVLSAAGLLPAALLGHDVAALLKGAREVRDQAGKAKDGDDAALAFAAWATTMFRDKGRSTLVFIPYASRLRELGDWVCQLWAESLGKQRNLAGKRVDTGQTPLTAVGPSAQHSILQLLIEGPQDKLVAFLRVKHFGSAMPLGSDLDYAALDIPWLNGKDLADVLHAQLEGTRAALSEASRPNLCLTLERLDEAGLGALFMFFELATVYAGGMLGIDPYGQPGVERGKQLSRQQLGG